MRGAVGSALVGLGYDAGYSDDVPAHFVTKPKDGIGLRVEMVNLVGRTRMLAKSSPDGNAAVVAAFYRRLESDMGLTPCTEEQFEEQKKAESARRQKKPEPVDPVMAALGSKIVNSTPGKSPEDFTNEHMLKSFELMTNDKGLFIARFIARWGSVEHVSLFVGDGKVFREIPTRYESSDIPPSSEPKEGAKNKGVQLANVFNDPRFVFNQEDTLDDSSHDKVDAALRYVRPGKYSVRCGSQIVDFNVLPSDKALPMLQGATYQRSPLDWKPYALGRDEHGTYYYVDAGRWEDNERVFRVFLGKKGNVKPVELKNIVHDSEGDIFTTRQGDLRLTIGKQKGSWLKKGVKQKVLLVPIEDNLSMIYNELGAYEGARLGTPCDDF